MTAPPSETDEWRDESEEVGQTATTEPTDAADSMASAQERRTEADRERSGALATLPEATPPPAAGTTSDPAAVPPDNTKKNERDRDPGSVTPPDQSNQKSDLKITQEIRKAVMGDSALSFTAKNVKIITSGGKVTLRGPVKTEAEHAAIVAAARRIAGDANVTDQIEVKEK